MDINILKNKDIIYSKTDFIYDLFEIIKNINIELKIITSESDIAITKHVFESKPSCVKKWFAVNVCYDHEDLIPIPLGISNGNCTITLKFSNIEETNEQKNKLLYINHRISTNSKDRSWIYDCFKTNNWCTVSQPNLSLDNYKKQLSQHHYMMCPRGNGVDTHRLWECLFMGVIPIVEKHITHKNIHDLPILFVNNFKEITEEFLISNLESIKNKNKNKLNIYYWEKIIRNCI